MKRYDEISFISFVVSTIVKSYHICVFVWGVLRKMLVHQWISLKMHPILASAPRILLWGIIFYPLYPFVFANRRCFSHFIFKDITNATSSDKTLQLSFSWLFSSFLFINLGIVFLFIYVACCCHFSLFLGGILGPLVVFFLLIFFFNSIAQTFVTASAPSAVNETGTPQEKHLDVEFAYLIKKHTPSELKWLVSVWTILEMSEDHRRKRRLWLCCFYDAWTWWYFKWPELTLLFLVAG